jgi:hypothetical protein
LSDCSCCLRYLRIKTITNSLTQRALVGIPNFWNVVSNIPFIAIGAGLRRFHNDPATVVLFLEVFALDETFSYNSR